MLEISFHELNSVSESELKFAVIMSRYKRKWIFVKHKERETWEIPGGHKEVNEKIETAASRELIEETGANDFSIFPLCIYSVDSGKNKTFGQLYYSEIKTLGELPNHEIVEIGLYDVIPENLTYPMIQPYLFEKVQELILDFE